MKNANLKKRIMATVVSTAVAFGGVAVAAPSADADVRITSQYSQLGSTEAQAAVNLNARQYVNRNMDMMQTMYGPGWCIDAHLEVPQANTQYEVRKLDGTSGFYGFNLQTGGDLKIHKDIERAAINLTKLMLTDYKAGRAEAVKQKNVALQALLSNNQQMLDQMRGVIFGKYGVEARTINGVRYVPPKVTKEQFLQWTGFEIRENYGVPLGQSQFYLVKNDAIWNGLNAQAGEYVTVLVPRTYNVYEDLSQEPTNQRIIIVAQPGLKGFDPFPEGPQAPRQTTVTKTVTPAPVTVTEAKPGGTTTVTVRGDAPTQTVRTTVRPTVTDTAYIQPVEEVYTTVTGANSTITTTRRPSVVTSTTTVTNDVEPVTVTETAPRSTVTEYEQEPVTSTVTVTEKPTITETAPDKTSIATTTAKPVIETITETAPAVTETVTKTADVPTSVVTETVTKTNVQTTEKTVVVDRTFRHFNYSYDFGGSNESREIPVPNLSNWRIEFVDDSNGLVKVERVIVDGKETLRITPVKEGRGTVRIMVVDNEGTRHEYTIDVVNEKSKQVDATNIVVNNHFFNIGRRGFELPIALNGKKYTVKEGSDLIDYSVKNDTLNVKVKDDKTTGKVVIELLDEKTGNRDNYIFQVNVSENTTTKTLVIGNSNPYTLDIPDVNEKPNPVKGGDLIEKIEKKGDFWVITPKAGREGEVTLEVKDTDGVVYTYTLQIKNGVNVGIYRESIEIIEGNSIFIEGKPNQTLKWDASYNTANWEVPTAQENGGWTIKNKVNDTGVFRIYETIAGQEVLIGEYTVKANPLEYESDLSTSRIKDTDTAILRKGDARNSFKTISGDEFFTWSEKNGNRVVTPNTGAKGTIEIGEYSDNNGTPVLLKRYVIEVEPTTVKTLELDALTGGTVTVSGLSNRKVEVVSGGEFVREIQGNDIILKPNTDGRDVEGTVELDVKNDRGQVVQKIRVNVTSPKIQLQEGTIVLNSQTELTLDLQDENYTYTQSNGLVKIVKNGTKLTVVPTDGAEGETVVDIKDAAGNVRYRYTITVQPAGDTVTRENTYRVTEGGNFTIVKVNDSKIRIETGSEHVNEPRITNGQWTITPKDGTAGNKVVVVEERNGQVVVRHEVTITPVATDLKITEERRVLNREIDGKITPSKPGTRLEIRRGRDYVEEIPTKPGQLFLKPADKKNPGTVIVEELDEVTGAVVRIIEIDVPSDPGVPEPIVLSHKPKDNDPYRVEVNGGSNSIEVNMCTGDNSCTLLTSGVTRNSDGSYSIDPGVVKDDTKKFEVIGIDNGIRRPGSAIEINVVNEIEQGNKGSSEETKRCLATLAGLSAPLLLLIPLGILAQVQIPGLEGVSAQINSAVREANDYIQRGLGVYDHERAQRAAGIQGAFQAVNPEFIGLAAGTFGAIAVGLILTDIALRNCGKPEFTSSYQLGKAIDSEWLMNASSTDAADGSTDKK